MALSKFIYQFFLTKITKNAFSFFGDFSQKTNHNLQIHLSSTRQIFARQKIAPLLNPLRPEISRPLPSDRLKPGAYMHIRRDRNGGRRKDGSGQKSRLLLSLLQYVLYVHGRLAAPSRCHTLIGRLLPNPNVPPARLVAVVQRNCNQVSVRARTHASARLDGKAVQDSQNPVPAVKSNRAMHCTK